MKIRSSTLYFPLKSGVELRIFIDFANINNEIEKQNLFLKKNAVGVSFIVNFVNNHYGQDIN